MANDRLAHQMIVWLLDCGHAVTCNCQHEIDGPAYCYMCQETCMITDREVRLTMQPNADKSLINLDKNVSRHV